MPGTGPGMTKPSALLPIAIHGIRIECLLRAAELERDRSRAFRSERHRAVKTGSPSSVTGAPARLRLGGGAVRRKPIAVSGQGPPRVIDGKSAARLAVGHDRTCHGYWGLARVARDSAERCTSSGPQSTPSP